jgi:uncharacterized ferritin-like protein (DUF455 family)
MTEVWYLPGAQARGRYMRLDAATILKRFFFCERALVIGQSGWLGWIASLEAKTSLPRLAWEDALTAHALRERVFELRYPSRLLEVGGDAPVVDVFTAAMDAPIAEAYVLALGRVLVPELLAAYEAYLAGVDEIADGPSRRFLTVAVAEKQAQVVELERLAGLMLAAAPERRAEAEAWAAAVEGALAAVGGVTLEPPLPAAKPSLPSARRLKIAEPPARDPAYNLCNFYWPDMIDPTFPYGDGLRLQLRTAVSHLNEAWAVETAGAILFAFADELGWEFVYDAARWCYDESRHCRMGMQRLANWGFAPAEIPLGTYIYDSAAGQPPVYRLGMLYFFETKNIGKKNERARAFSEYGDDISQHDMEFDWADETIHAHFGNHWLKALHDARPADIPAPDALRSRCAELVQATIASATEAERRAIREVAEALIDKAERIAKGASHP